MDDFFEVGVVACVAYDVRLYLAAFDDLVRVEAEGFGLATGIHARLTPIRKFDRLRMIMTVIQLMPQKVQFTRFTVQRDRPSPELPINLPRVKLLML